MELFMRKKEDAAALSKMSQLEEYTEGRQLILVLRSYRPTTRVPFGKAERYIIVLVLWRKARANFPSWLFVVAAFHTKNGRLVATNK